MSSNSSSAGEDLDYQPGYLETLGIEDFTMRREFGREKGYSPVLTEAQVRALNKLMDKLATKPNLKGKKEDDEDLINFDLRDSIRAILFEGKVLKRSTNAIVQHSSRRHMVLLSDVVLITSVQSAAGLMSSEKLCLHQVLYLNKMSIVDIKLIQPDGDPCAFEIRTADKSYYLAAESETDKKIWLEELESAIFCIMSQEDRKRLGWQHFTVLGTLYSAAILGDCELLERHCDKMVGQSLDTADEAGMSAIHWAALFGHLNAVRLLVERGSHIDQLNSGLNSPLLLAASRGYDDVVFYLIDQGADIFVRNLKDIDCLLMSVLYGNHGEGLKNIITALQCKGVALDKVDSYGATPLHECAGRNLSWPVQILVDAGCDVNVKHGRNGLTPLQMACSNPCPDPETVRSFLDKGAHPNWRDTAKRSAFDLVLAQHQKKMADSRNKAAAGNRSMMDTLDEVSEFVQNALPVLMELVRKGGRYSDESVAVLRASFQEALKTGRELWNRQVSPPAFSQYYESKVASQDVGKPSWTADSASPHCMLCVEKFTMSNRRHHCRGCGILCCDLCSAKKLEYKSTGPPPPPAGSKDSRRMTGSPTPPAANTSSKGGEGSRTCDGCFNKYSFECSAWYANLQKIRRDQEKAEAERAKKDHPSVKAVGNVNNSVAGVNSTMNEALQSMDERGQKLQQLNEKAEIMNESASEFNKMTKKLLQQQQQRSAWG